MHHWDEVYEPGPCTEIHKSQGRVVMCKHAVIYSNIDTRNKADLSPVCLSGRGRDIKNSYGDGRRCHIEYVASCSDDHGQ